MAVLLLLPVTSSAQELRATDAISRHVLAPFAQDFAAPADLGLEAESVEIVNPFGYRLRGWHFQRPDAEQTILICMGNTGNIACMLQYAEIFANGGFNVLMFDYQGFGRSEGTASVLSLPGDATAAFDYLVSERGVAPKNIGVFGISLGSILALAVAADGNAGAVATEDVFLPARFLDAFEQHVGDDPLLQFAIEGVRTTILPRVDPLQTVTRLNCPLFLLHGERDRLLPPTGSTAVAAAAAVPTRVWIMPGTGHAPESLEVNDREFRSQLRRFFRDAFAGNVQDRRLQWSAADAGRAGTVDIAVDHHLADQPLQVCVADDGGQFEFFCVYADPREPLRVQVPFEPRHVSAVVVENAHPDDNGQWKPALSELSRDLQRFRRLQRELDERARRFVRDPGGSGRIVALYYDAAAWSQFRSQIPEPADVHPRVRPRYARWLAFVERRLRHPRGVPELTAGTLAVKFLPEDPESYYQLDDASFELGLFDANLANILLWVARNELELGNSQSARELLAMYLRVLPPNQAPILSQGHVDAIDESTPPAILPDIPDRRLIVAGPVRRTSGQD